MTVQLETYIVATKSIWISGRAASRSSAILFALIQILGGRATHRRNSKQYQLLALGTTEINCERNHLAMTKNQKKHVSQIPKCFKFAFSPSSIPLFHQIFIFFPTCSMATTILPHSFFHVPLPMANPWVPLGSPDALAPVHALVEACSKSWPKRLGVFTQWTNSDWKFHACPAPVNVNNSQYFRYIYIPPVDGQYLTSQLMWSVFISPNDFRLGLAIPNGDRIQQLLSANQHEFLATTSQGMLRKPENTWMGI